jgi:VanZ family protein
MTTCFNFRILAIIWMMLIFVLSSRMSLPAVSLFSGADLAAHAAFYGVLVMLLARSLAPHKVLTWKRVLLLTMLVTAYGVTDECHQVFVPGRNASGWDILGDGLGGLVMASVLVWWDRRRADGSRPAFRGKDIFMLRAVLRPCATDEDKR